MIARTRTRIYIYNKVIIQRERRSYFYNITLAMLEQWELIVAAIVFGLGLLVAIVMAITNVMRSNNNEATVDAKTIEVLSPVSTMSAYFGMGAQMLMTKQQNATSETYVTTKVDGKTRTGKFGHRTDFFSRPQQIPVDDYQPGYGQQQPFPWNGGFMSLQQRAFKPLTYEQIRTIWAQLYAIVVSISTTIIVAFVLLTLYIALYLDLGYYLRADAVNANYLTWISVTINFPVLLVSFIYMTGSYKSGVGLFELFGIGALAFLVGTSFALGVICSGDTQWLGLGAGLFIHILVGLLIIYMLRDTIMLACGLLEQEASGACTLIRVGAGLIWGYFTIKALFLILGPEYTNVLDLASTNIAQLVTDLAFYITLTIIAYVAASRIELWKFIVVGRKHDIKLNSYSPKVYSSYGYGMVPTTYAYSM